MVEPCCVAYNGIFISAGGFLPGSNVLVAGCGPVGLMGIALARAAGAAKVIVMEPSHGAAGDGQDDGRRLRLRSRSALRKQGNRPADIIMEATRGDGVLMCIEAAAAGTKTYPIFEEVLAPSGKIVQCGMGAERVPISVLKLQWQRLHIHGSVGHSGGIFPTSSACWRPSASTCCPWSPRASRWTRPSRPSSRPRSWATPRSWCGNSMEDRHPVKITAIKAMQPKQGTTLIKIETDAGICGYGPCGASGPFGARRHRRPAKGRACRTWA